MKNNAGSAQKADPAFFNPVLPPAKNDSKLPTYI